MSEDDGRLNVVRELLARREAFRAVSIPTAAVGGALSLANSAWTVHWLASSSQAVIHIQFFVLSWAAVLSLTCATGTLFFLRRHHLGADALRVVVRAVFPPFATAAAATALFYWNGAAFSMAITWITLYGLTLLATGFFAPRPVIVLGSAFLVTGIAMMLFVHLRIIALIGYSRSDTQTALLMASTFGLYHVVYAVGAGVAARGQGAPYNSSGGNATPHER